MYIRIQDNSIRFRVSQNEARQLTEGEAIESSLALSTSQTLTYGINTTLEANWFEFDNNTNGLWLFVNSNELQKEIEGRPSKRGLIFTQSFSEQNITVSLEIDLKRK